MPSVDRFAYPVGSIADLAPPVAAALEAELLPGETIRQIIFAPRQDHLVAWRRLRGRLNARLPWQKTPDWVLALTEEHLLVAIISDAASIPRITATPIADMLWLELGTILLYAWFAWAWGDGGTVHRQQVYFNAVRDGLFWQMANAIRRKSIAQTDPPLPAGENRLDPYEDLPFKFRNLIPHRFMFPGEQAQAVVYQPAIWGRRLRVFRDQRAPTTVVVLSPEYLLVVQDDLTNMRASYGLIGRYCPRGCIRRASLEPIQGDLWLSVTLGLQEAEETLRWLFEPATEPALQNLIAAVVQDDKCPPTLSR